jgi:hypothetical protein
MSPWLCGLWPCLSRLLLTIVDGQRDEVLVGDAMLKANGGKGADGEPASQTGEMS